MFAAADTEVMADLIVNHVSRHSRRFQDYDARGHDSPYAGIGISQANPGFRCEVVSLSKRCNLHDARCFFPPAPRFFHRRAAPRENRQTA